jgi:hypothetical protein
MAARGASCAAGAARTLPSPTAWSEPASDPLVDCRFGDAKRTPQHGDVWSFEAYYAILPARVWPLSASSEPPKGMYVWHPLSPDAGRRSGEPEAGNVWVLLAPETSRRLGRWPRASASFPSCVRLLRSPPAFASCASRACLPRGPGALCPSERAYFITSERSEWPISSASSLTCPGGLACKNHVPKTCA